MHSCKYFAIRAKIKTSLPYFAYDAGIYLVWALNNPQAKGISPNTFYTDKIDKLKKKWRQKFMYANMIPKYLIVLNNTKEQKEYRIIKS